MNIQIRLLILTSYIFTTSAIRKSSLRVIGGEHTDVEHFPFIVSLQSNEKHLCGGALFKEDWVLTASHCLMMATECEMRLRNPKFYNIMAGSTEIDNRHHKGQIVNCIAFIPHPEFQPDDLINDIGLVKLEKGVKVGKSVQIAQISDFFSISSAAHEHLNNEVKEKCTVVGWGFMGIKERAEAEVLQSTMLDVIPRKLCKEKLTGHVVPENDMCMLSEVGKGSCYGDSGGPIVCDGKKVEALVSGSVGDLDCAITGMPYLFVRIVPYDTWIDSVITNMPQVSRDPIKLNKTKCDAAKGFTSKRRAHVETRTASRSSAILCSVIALFICALVSLISTVSRI